MKKRTLGHWIGAAGLLLFGSGVRAENHAADQQTLEKVRSQIAAYERIWNTHDGIKLAVFFTNDADMVMGNGPVISGREALGKWWSRYFAAISEKRTGRFKVDSLRLVTPDVVLANIISLTRGGSGDDETLPARHARGTWVMVKQDGEWRIAAMRGLPAEGEVRYSPGTDSR